MPATKPYNALLHRLALVTAVATFPLIFMGGLVTSHGAAMSVPDWPNTWGYNMFTFPPSKWVGGILFEHTHRLAASVVGMLTIAIVVAAVHQRRCQRTAVALLIAVCLQGLIGGLRVILNTLLPWLGIHEMIITPHGLAIVHGCAAQLFFCFIAAFCVITSRFWSHPPHLTDVQQTAVQKIHRISIVAVTLIVMQLVIGAVMRHSNAGLAIPDFPMSFGHWLPPTTLDADFREQAIHQFGPDLDLNRVTLFQIWIHFAHRISALMVTIAVLWLSIAILIRLGGLRSLTLPAIALLLLLPAQITLGILTVLMRKPADIASTHVAIGALTLVTAWVTLLRTVRLRRFAAPNSQPAALAHAASPFPSPAVNA